MDFSALFLLVLVLLSSCSITALNTTYDSARSLKKGELKAGTGIAQISSEELDNNERNNRFTNPLYGSLHLTYGVSDNYDVRLNYFRYLRSIISPQNKSNFNLYNLGSPISYVQIDNKITLVENLGAVSLPVGLYIYDDIVLTTLNLRFHLSVSDKIDQIELNFYPWLNIIYINFSLKSTTRR